MLDMSLYLFGFIPHWSGGVWILPAGALLGGGVVFAVAVDFVVVIVVAVAGVAPILIAVNDIFWM